jgi:hypothetical protein
VSPNQIQGLNLVCLYPPKAQRSYVRPTFSGDGSERAWVNKVREPSVVSKQISGAKDAADHEQQHVTNLGE